MLTSGKKKSISFSSYLTRHKNANELSKLLSLPYFYFLLPQSFNMIFFFCMTNRLHAGWPSRQTAEKELYEMELLCSIGPDQLLTFFFFFLYRSRRSAIRLRTTRIYRMDSMPLGSRRVHSSYAVSFNDVPRLKLRIWLRLVDSTKVCWGFFRPCWGDFFGLICVTKSDMHV